MVDKLGIFLLIHLMLSIQVQTLDIDHWGTHFVFSFLRNLDLSGRNIVMVTARERTDVVVTVQETNTKTEFTLDAGETRQLTYGSSVLARPYSEVLERRAVSVEASAKVSVYGFSSDSRTTDGFLAIPVPALGTHYMGITSYGGRPQIVIVGIENGTTVKASLTGSNYCLHIEQGWLEVSEENYEFTLNEYDVYCFYCNKRLSGSVIQSDKPIAVLSGNLCTKIPENSYCDHATEMLPPISNWGTSFIVTAPTGHTNGAVLTILAWKNDTQVHMNSTVYSLDARNYTSLNVGQGSTFCVTSNNEILVAMFMEGSGDESGTEYLGDAYLDLVTPTNRFTNEYLVDAISDVNLTYYVVIISQKEERDLIIPSVSGFTNVCNMAHKVQNFSGATKFVSRADFHLSVYAFGNREGLAYPAGRKFLDFSGTEECSTAICQNGGFCLEVGWSYRCRCSEQYTGTHCEIAITTPAQQDLLTTQESSTVLTTTQEPSTTTQEPSTTTQEPSTTTQEPSTIPTTTQESSTTTQEPSTTTQEPSTVQTTTQEPSTIPTTTQEPPTTTQEPSTTTQEPSTTTQEPSSTTTQEPSTSPTKTQESSTTQSTTQEPSTIPTTTQEPSTASVGRQEPVPGQIEKGSSNTTSTTQDINDPVSTATTTGQLSTTTESWNTSEPTTGSSLVFKPIGYRSCNNYCVQCPCPCPDRETQERLENLENSLEYARKEQQKLTLDKSLLSKKVRTKTSAPNIERYEITIGITSVTIVVTIFSIIFMMDAPRVIGFAMNYRR